MDGLCSSINDKMDSFNVTKLSLIADWVQACLVTKDYAFNVCSPNTFGILSNETFPEASLNIVH